MAVDRRLFLDQFRQRLIQVIETSGQSRSAFATGVGMDRSTLSQLLSPSNDRLPRVESLAAIASTHSVSIDWLLGLSQAGQLGPDIMDEQQPASIEGVTGPSADEKLMGWLREASGYKVRYVPSTLPDLLKSEAVFRYELGHFVSGNLDQAMEAAHQRLALQRQPENEMEACSSVQSVAGFVRGEGLWRQIKTETRRAQIDQMIDLVEELYPSFRWFLFDGLQRYSVPITIFGPLRASIYLGQMYLVITATEQIRILTQHFDGLIRGAVIQPPDVPRYLRQLRMEIS